MLNLKSKPLVACFSQLVIKLCIVTLKMICSKLAETCKAQSSFCPISKIRQLIKNVYLL